MRTFSRRSPLGGPKTSQLGGQPAGPREMMAATGKRMAIKQGRDLDERVGLAGAGKWLLNYIFPDHWSFMLGEIALYSFLILVITGVYLAFFFTDSLKDVVYHGSYVPLQGVHMSEAYQSVVNISFGIRSGLVMRQMHHWAALIFIAAIGVHMCRIFFTGAFRKPREVNWTIGLILLTLALGNGFFGYSLPDDLLSGSGLRIAYSVAESIPIVGTWIAEFLFGGNFPGNAIIERMYVLHVFVLPLLIFGLLGAHLAIIMRQHHSQFPGKGATETNTVGSPMWPGYMAKTTGYFFMTFAVIGGLGGLAQINPIWLFGPYDPYRVSSFTYPDWYIGWLDGLLRLWPRWETHFPGHMIPNAFFPAILIPGVIFTFLGAYPFLESKLTGDKLYHNLLDRPRDRPVRTAVGAGLIALFFVMLLAGSEDDLAVMFSTSVQAVVWSLRIAFFLLPLAVGAVTYLLCNELASVPDAGKRKRFSVIVRTPEGGYTMVATEPRPGDHHPELTAAPLSEAGEFPELPEKMPVMASAARTAGGPIPEASAESTTSPSGIPGVRTVVRRPEEAPRPRGLRLGLGRREQGAGDGTEGPDGTGA